MGLLWFFGFLALARNAWGQCDPTVVDQGIVARLTNSSCFRVDRVTNGVIPCPAGLDCCGFDVYAASVVVPGGAASQVKVPASMYYKGGVLRVSNVVLGRDYCVTSGLSDACASSQGCTYTLLDTYGACCPSRPLGTMASPPPPPPGNPNIPPYPAWPPYPSRPPTRSPPVRSPQVGPSFPYCKCTKTTSSHLAVSQEPTQSSTETCFRVTKGDICTGPSKCCDFGVTKLLLDVVPGCTSAVAYATLNNGSRLVVSSERNPGPVVKFVHGLVAGDIVCFGLRKPCATVETLCGSSNCRYSLIGDIKTPDYCCAVGVAP